MWQSAIADREAWSIEGGIVVTRKNALSVAEIDKTYHLHPFTSVAEILQDGPLVIDKGRGVYVEDDRGRELIDGAAGLWCVNVGHGREEIITAIEQQMRRLDYFQSFSGATNEPVAQLSARVLELAPTGMSRVFFGNSGSDAADSAIKMVTLYNNLRGKTEEEEVHFTLARLSRRDSGGGKPDGPRKCAPAFRSAVAHRPPYRSPGRLSHPRPHGERLCGQSR